MPEGTYAGECPIVLDGMREEFYRGPVRAVENGVGELAEEWR